MGNPARQPWALLRTVEFVPLTLLLSLLTRISRCRCSLDCVRWREFTAW